MSIFDVMYNGIILHIIAIIFETIHLHNQQLLGVYLCYTNCMNTDYSRRNFFYTEFSCNIKMNGIDCYLYHLLKSQLV